MTGACAGAAMAPRGVMSSASTASAAPNRRAIRAGRAPSVIFMRCPPRPRRSGVVLQHLGARRHGDRIDIVGAFHPDAVAIDQLAAEPALIRRQDEAVKDVESYADQYRQLLR